MAKKTTYICDRCGKEHDQVYRISDYCAQIKLWAIGEPRSSGGQRFDLCEDCFAQFISFLEEGENYGK